MNENVVKALLEVKRELGDEMLTEVSRVDAFLADSLYDAPGERRLLVSLLREGVPGRLTEARFADDAELDGLARHWADRQLMNERATRQAMRVWRWVVRADADAEARPIDMRAILGSAGDTAEPTRRSMEEPEARPVAEVRPERGRERPAEPPRPPQAEEDASTKDAPAGTGGLSAWWANWRAERERRAEEARRRKAERERPGAAAPKRRGCLGVLGAALWAFLALLVHAAGACCVMCNLGVTMFLALAIGDGVLGVMDASRDWGVKPGISSILLICSTLVGWFFTYVIFKVNANKQHLEFQTVCVLAVMEVLCISLWLGALVMS